MWTRTHTHSTECKETLSCGLASQLPEAAGQLSATQAVHIKCIQMPCSEKVQTFKFSLTGVNTGFLCTSPSLVVHI